MKLEQLYEHIEAEKLKYHQAHKLNYRRNLTIVLPAIIITSLSSMLSFISSSDIIPDDTIDKKYIVLSIGMLTSIASIFQTLSSAFAFNVKSEMFRKAADSYDKLITKIEFERVTSNSQGTSSELLNEMETKILEIKDECKYLPPELTKKLKKKKKYNNYEIVI